jgi:hypothetical protein
MSESLKTGCSLPAKGRIEDTMKKPQTAKDAAKKKKKKKRSEKKDSEEKRKKDAYRAIPESLTGRQVSWSRSYLESTDELPFIHDDLVQTTKSSHRHRRRLKPFDESQTSALTHETVDDLEREKDAATVVLDPNGFPLDESAISLDLFDLKDQDEPHSNSPHNFEESFTSTRIPHPESHSHLLHSFASFEKSLTLSHLQDSLTSMQLQDSNTTMEKSLTLSHLRDSHTSMHLQDSNTSAEKSLTLSHPRNSDTSKDLQNNLQDSTQSFGGLDNFPQKNGLDAKAAINTQTSSSSGSTNSSALGYKEDADDSCSDGDWDDPFRESKFWGSESTLHIGDDDDVKSFREDSDAWASFGRMFRNETFVKRVSSKDMICCSTHSTPSTSTRSPERSGEDKTLTHGNLTASQRSIRSFSAPLNPYERTVKQQLASLSLSQRACVAQLKSQWEEYDGGKNGFPDDLYLRFARCSPGNPFNIKSAWKVMKRVECRYFHLQMSKVEKSVLAKVTCTVRNFATFYLVSF